jgi:hypothetical protein
LAPKQEFLIIHHRLQQFSDFELGRKHPWLEKQQKHSNGDFIEIGVLSVGRRQKNVLWLFLKTYWKR